MRPAAALSIAALALCCSSAPQHSAVQVQRAWPVMGTMLTITAWGVDSADVLCSVKAARAAVMRVDSLMSSYRDESDVTRLAKGAGSPVRVSAETIHVLLLARNYWNISKGKFDPTIGPLTDLWARARAEGKIPSTGELAAARSKVGFALVEIDSAKSTVRLPLKGMRIDLGGIAKGFALDQARDAMKPGAASGMVDLGGNVLVFGRSPFPGGRWKIGIVDPRDSDAIVGTVELDSGAVATSGDNENFTLINGVRYSHIIDPLTGSPARGLASATAIGPRGEWSDGMSASLFLLGNSAGIRAADSLGNVGAIIIADRNTGSVHRPDVTLSALARRVFRFESLFR